MDAILAHARADPAYAGTNSSAGGRRRELSPSEETRLQRFLEAEVGVSRVTIPFCRKRLPFLRRLSEESVRLALRRLGLAWRPVELERRDAFLRRLRRAVLHLNKRFRAEARRLCRNQHQWAMACLNLSGAHTRW